jgi:conserved oligomeric Golgi complex subunit 6
MMQTAISYLRRLPIYFSQCQDLVVNSRRSQLVQKFVVALTQGGPSGQVFRAMDLHAHDSVRYVGDMLAWMHQAVASEEEFLEAVFGEPSSKRSSKSDDMDGSGSAVAAVDSLSSSSKGTEKELVGLSVQELLARCLQGLGRPLRVRIIQVNKDRFTLFIFSKM